MAYFYGLTRAVAQLGRAPGSGQSPDDFLKLSQRALTCSTLGKSPNSRDLNSPPNALRFFHRWIKQWIKDSGGWSAPAVFTGATMNPLPHCQHLAADLKLRF